MIYYLRNNICVSVVSFLLSLLLELIGRHSNGYPGERYVYFAILLLFLVGFYLASFLALRNRLRKSVLISMISAPIWLVLTEAATVYIFLASHVIHIH